MYSHGFDQIALSGAGYARDYEKKDDFGHFVRMISALPFAPPEQLDQVHLKTNDRTWTNFWNLPCLYNKNTSFDFDEILFFDQVLQYFTTFTSSFDQIFTILTRFLEHCSLIWSGVWTAAWKGISAQVSRSSKIQRRIGGVCWEAVANRTLHQTGLEPFQHQRTDGSSNQ